MARWTVNTKVLEFPAVSLGEWDADATEKTWRKWVSSKDPSEWGRREWMKYRQRFMVYDAEDPMKFESYKLPVVAIVRGKPRLVREAVIAAQRALAGARRGVDLPEDVKKRLVRLAERCREKVDKVAGKGD